MFDRIEMPDLRRRATDLQELMDDPACDLTALRRTYAQFRIVNRLVSGWGHLYRSRLRPLLSANTLTTLLDVGCGGGDVPRALAGWAARDGLRLGITAIDPDPRAHAFASRMPGIAGLTFRRASSAELVAEGSRFDVVCSNHLLHHLDPVELADLLSDSRLLARRLVLHNDIARSRWAYLGYAVASSPFGRHSFIHIDGLMSIRRSYRVAELAAELPSGWCVGSQFPARVLVT